MSEVQRVLAAPGAGIPGLERRLARVGLLAYSRLTRPGTVIERFRREAERAAAIADRLDSLHAGRPVLIDRIPGLEDSSRNWSVYMTIEHLATVNRGIFGVINALMAGDGAALGEVRIEDVKPSPQAGVGQIERLRVVVDAYVESVSAMGRLRSTVRHAHPWFGPLDARQWNALAAVHNALHRRQIDQILRLQE